MSTATVALPEAIQLVPSALAISRPPDQVLEEARKAATALKSIIDAKPNKVSFNGETYLENEDWLTVARFYGVTSRISRTKYIEYGDEEFPIRGFEAIAEAFLVSTGQVISTSESMCLDDERNWKAKPLFQLRSMAQTRASSRVLRQVFGWVVVLAGYKPTPAEEISGIENPNTCEKCGKAIKAGKWGDQKYTAAQVMILSRKLHGKEYCGDCLQVVPRDPPKSKPVSSDAACQIRAISDGGLFVRGVVTGVFPGVPLSIKMGEELFQCWHKDSLAPVLKESRGKKVEFEATVKDTGLRVIEKIITINGVAWEPVQAKRPTILRPAKQAAAVNGAS